MNVEVVSVSRRAQAVSKSPSAVFVITREDIRRLGVTNIPEALRMAPGVHVARLDGNKWAVGVRGFSDRFTDNLLVMVDGRSVYTPLFSGVYWEALEMPLEDIKRIEVVRGPGGTMWGSNAVNGVINIITMNAEDTQGSTTTVGGGTHDRAYGTARYGGALDNGVFYRVSSRGVRREAPEGGERGGDDWTSLQGGFRADWKSANSMSTMVSGNVYRGGGGGLVSVPSLSAAPPYNSQIEDDIELSGSNILTRWTKAFKDDSAVSLQVYYDHFDRQEALGRYRTDSVDFDFQHDVKLTGSQRLLWGVGYRTNTDSIETRTPFVQFAPDSLRTSILNLMVEDDIGLIGEQLVLTLGAKLERNSYTGWETQPAATLIWNRSSSTALWGSVSRAVRIPARYNRDIQIDVFGFPTGIGVPGVVRLNGTPEPKAESLVAYQLGYRTNPLASLTLDLAAFVNFYDDMFGQVDQAPFLDASYGFPVLVMPLRNANALQGTTRGTEVQATYRVLDRWQLSGSYSWLNAALRPQSGATGQGEDRLNHSTPKHLVTARSLLNLPGRLELDVTLFHTGAGGAFDELRDRRVAAYHRLDARLGWRPSERFNLSFSIENLLNDRHLEVVPSALGSSSEFGRNAHVRGTFSF